MKTKEQIIHEVSQLFPGKEYYVDFLLEANNTPDNELIMQLEHLREKMYGLLSAKTIIEKDKIAKATEEYVKNLIILVKIYKIIHE